MSAHRKRGALDFASFEFDPTIVNRSNFPRKQRWGTSHHKGSRARSLLTISFHTRRSSYVKRGQAVEIEGSANSFKNSSQVNLTAFVEAQFWEDDSQRFILFEHRFLGRTMSSRPTDY